MVATVFLAICMGLCFPDEEWKLDLPLSSLGILNYAMFEVVELQMSPQ